MRTDYTSSIISGCELAQLLDWGQVGQGKDVHSWVVTESALLVELILKFLKIQIHK
jgi:hypothetical protein